jgi:tripartite ATP-independent transporter DctM subunit
MLAAGYERDFSAGITAASALIGPIIPPSIALVAYGVSAEVSIGALFMAGIVPGLLLTLIFMAYVAVLAQLRDFPSGPFAPLRELLLALRRALLPLMMPVIIIGGIRGGIFTPTEAAAIAAFYATLLSCLVYREIGGRQLLGEIRQAMVDSAVIMLIIAFTSAFGVVMIHGQVPQNLAAIMARLTDDPTVLMLLLTVVWMAVGLFMAQTPAILVLTPILVPTAQLFGIDLIFFGIVMTLALTLGLLTPPVGMVLFALTRVTGLSFERLSLVALPYIALVLVVIVLLILVPELVLFLPNITR